MTARHPSFYRNAFGQISGLVDIATAAYCTMISQELQWNDFEYRKQIFVSRRQRDEMIGAFNQVRFILVSDGDDDPVA